MINSVCLTDRLVSEGHGGSTDILESLVTCTSPLAGATSAEAGTVLPCSIASPFLQIISGHPVRLSPPLSISCISQSHVSGIPTLQRRVPVLAINPQSSFTDSETIIQTILRAQRSFVTSRMYVENTRSSTRSNWIQMCPRSNGLRTRSCGKQPFFI